VIVRDEIADLKKAKQYCFPKLDRVVTVSEDLRAQLVEDASLYSRAETIYNIVEHPPVFTDAADTIRTLCGSFPVVQKWLLTAGTVCPRKDQILTVQTLAELVQRGHSDLGLLIAGGDDGGDLQQAIEARGLTNRVAFAGQINGIGAALEAAVAFVMTSHSEGLPRVLIESGLAEVPSVSTRVSGVGEVYGEHAGQFVSETRSPSELADKIEPILSGSAQQTFGALASNMEKQFCSETHTKSWKQLLRYV
jgi:glycosyltransferase involved in cell wall biosynthesis